jgi:hypothetical protein
MIAFSTVLKTFVIIFCCWIVGCFALGKFEASNDGYNEIGFPLIFYRYFSGKCFSCKENGFFIEQLILDILFVFVIAFVVKFIVHKVKSNKRVRS